MIGFGQIFDSLVGGAWIATQSIHGLSTQRENPVVAEAFAADELGQAVATPPECSRTLLSVVARPMPSTWPIFTTISANPAGILSIMACRSCSKAWRWGSSRACTTPPKSRYCGGSSSSSCRMNHAILRLAICRWGRSTMTCPLKTATSLLGDHIRPLDAKLGLLKYEDAPIEPE